MGGAIWISPTKWYQKVHLLMDYKLFIYSCSMKTNCTAIGEDTTDPGKHICYIIEWSQGGSTTTQTLVANSTMNIWSKQGKEHST